MEKQSTKMSKKKVFGFFVAHGRIVQTAKAAWATAKWSDGNRVFSLHSCRMDRLCRRPAKTPYRPQSEGPWNLNLSKR